MRLQAPVKKSVAIGIIGVLLAILSFVPGLEPLFSNKPIDGTSTFWLICGVLVLFATVLIGSFLYVDDRLSDTDQDIKTISKNIREWGSKDNGLKHEIVGLLTLLKVNPDTLADPWLISTLQTLGARVQEIERTNPQYRPLFELSVDKALNEAAKSVGTPIRIDYTPDQEPLRIAQLSRAIILSRTTIEAVTFDIGDYFPIFWNPTTEHYREYLRVNKHAAQQGVHINRTFVMSREAIEVPSSLKYQRLQTILRDLSVICNDRCELVVVSLNDLDARQDIPKRSFLVCDDNVASEAFHAEAGPQGLGYFQVGVSQLVDQLRTRSFELRNFQNRIGLLRQERTKSAVPRIRVKDVQELRPPG